MRKLCILLFGILVLFQGSAQHPIVNEVRAYDTKVEIYSKFEASINLTATYNNPYNYDEVELKAVVQGPEGILDTIDGFFMEERKINTSSGETIITGPSTFKIRYAPTVVGDYNYSLIIRDSRGTATSENYSFKCVELSHDRNKGFIRSNNTNYLQFDEGEQYIPVGENMGWQTNNPYLDYSEWLEGLINVQGNFIRIWHSHFGLGIEWKNGWDDYRGLLKYNQVTSTYQDWLIDYCADNGIYLMITLQHHGQVSTQVNPNWSSNPYNFSNGGPLFNTWEFFSDSTAMAITKNRLRYIIARWGYARSIMSWEIFNEVDWTDDYPQYENDVIEWHLEMAGYIKSKDVNDHLISTSFFNVNRAERLWESPLIDFTQAHFYRNISDIYKNVVSLTTTLIESYQKPSIVGEFGLSGGADGRLDKDGIYLHNSLWASMLGGAMGAAVPWSWEDYIFEEDLYYHFSGISSIEKVIPFHEENMQRGSIITKGAEEDLYLIPNLNWGSIADSTIIIQGGGSTLPSIPNLSRFLYGSINNTEYRSPPIFEVNYPSDGMFSVTTGDQIGTLARIVVSIDDQIAIDTFASSNTTYEISIPEGDHIIKVDNTGTDWVSVASYLFSDQGSKIDGNVVMSFDGNTGAGWIVNKDYNHVAIADYGFPESISDASLVINNVRNFPHEITWYETLSGTKLFSEKVESKSNKLEVPIPELFWDLAFTFKIDNIVKTEITPFNPIAIEIFPNPVQKDNLVTLKIELKKSSSIISIYNVIGKPMMTHEIHSQNYGFVIPNSWPEGIYWLKVTDGTNSLIRPFIVAGG